MIRWALALATIGLVPSDRIAFAQQEAADDSRPDHKVEFLLDDAYGALATIGAGSLCNPIIADDRFRALRRDYDRLWNQAAALLRRDPRPRDISLYHCRSKRDVSYKQATRLKQRASHALKQVAALLRRGRLD